MKHVRVFGLLVLALVAGTAWAQNPGDVVITEVMYDDTASTDLEWAEIHNTTAAAIDLSNWTLIDGPAYPPTGEGSILIPAGTTIPADGYLVLCRVTIPEFEGEILCTQNYGSWTLGNSGDNLALFTAGGVMIDGSFTVFYPDLSSPGNSVEKCNVSSPWSGNATDWHQSLNEFATVGRYRFCTPGLANTPCPDTTPPAIQSITAANTTQVDVLFNESVELVSAETAANYVVTPGSLVPASAVRDAVNFALVHLTFAPLAENTYTLTVNGVQDMNFNVCVNATGTFAITSLVGDVLINEVMYDDTAGTDLEWAEIHNSTAVAIDISGWTLIDAPAYPPATEGSIQVPAGTILPADGYLVLCKLDIPEFEGEIVCTQNFGSWGLGNSGDNLALFAGDGTLIDGSLSVFYPDLSNPGYSIEKCDEHAAWTGDAAAWHQSTNSFATVGRYRFCTPGTQNSSCVVDTEPPALVSAAAVSETQVDVTFTEPVSTTTANDPLNYAVDNGIGNPVTAARQANTAVVRLTFAADLTPGNYLVTVNNVQDLAGNIIAPNSQAPFTVVAPPAEIIFTEVMPNPNFGGLADSLGEWFEVYNAGSTPVDMSGWTVSDIAGTDTIEDPAVIEPGAYFVFASNGDSATNGGVPENYAYRFGTSGWGLSMNNTSDTLVLKDAAGTLVAGLRYTVSFGWSEGRSAQLRDLAYNPAIDTSWCRADTIWVGATQNDHGTPGAATICAANLPAQFYTVCDLREQDDCGMPALEGRRIITQGIITYADSCRRNAYIEAGGCAVMLYGNAVRYNMSNAARRPLEGDFVQIEGYLKLFRGLSEIDSAFGLVPIVTLINAGNPLPAPVPIPSAVIDIHTASCLAEQWESRHVYLDNATFLAGDGVAMFAGNTNYNVVVGTDTFQFRTNVCDTLTGHLIPVGPVTLTGVLGQYDASSCYCQGYQVMTGNAAPFQTVVNCLDPVALTVLRSDDNALLDWEAGTGQPCDCYSVYYTTDPVAVFPAGYTLVPTPVTGVTQYLDTDPLAARRYYVVTAGGPNCP